MSSFIGDSTRKATATSQWPSMISAGVPLAGSTPGPECIEIVGQDGFTLINRTLIGGTTVLRLNDCKNFMLSGLGVYGMAGPADPDGHGIQLINSGGTLALCKIVADEQTEDHINIYGDRPETEQLIVHLIKYRLYGRGLSQSGCGVTVDGPHPPIVVIEDGYHHSNRCSITVAAGNGHVVRQITSIKANTDLYIFDGYGNPTKHIDLSNTGLKPSGVLIATKGPIYGKST